jgi:arabinosyltransferase C
VPRWFWIITFIALVAGSLPYVFGAAIQPEGSLYLGVHSNYDDHAVYASWAMQAKEGRFFFENRFTTDDQPGRTIHLYFLAVGWLAKAVGIPLAMHFFRVIFGFLALLTLFKFIGRVVEDETKRPFAFALSIVCAGIGFLFWRKYGFDGPIDVWQPEVFTFPMLMQNGLFCAALFLILSVCNCILEARTSWRPVLPGALAVLVLTNIHTYDTLMVGLVSAGFLSAALASRLVTAAWIGRSLVIALGAVPAVVWFIYVRGIDPVFAARADTVTISAPIWMMLAGLFPVLILSGIGLARGGNKWAVVGAAALFCLIGALQYSQDYRMDAIWASPPLWALFFALSLALCWFYKPKSTAYGLLFAWCLVGVIAVYYPGLFQRKLAMALAIPFAASAAVGLLSFEFSRKWATAAIAFLGLSSALWLARETQMATNNISNTTMQRVYWSADVKQVLGYFAKEAKPVDAVIAMPGIAVPDDFEKPRSYMIAIPDLNPVLTGWGGVKTYVGHWSETPDFLARRQRVMHDIFSPNATRESVFAAMREAKANYILAPVSDIAAQAGVPRRDFYTELGEVVYEGDEFVLVRYLPAP